VLCVAIACCSSVLCVSAAHHWDRLVGSQVTTSGCATAFARISNTSSSSSVMHSSTCGWIGVCVGGSERESEREGECVGACVFVCLCVCVCLCVFVCV